ncbi:MAG: hypothetical protein Q4B88_04905 [Moraxella sp.]|nr:hypothetical protein [Moraxella sp.]
MKNLGLSMIMVSCLLVMLGVVFLLAFMLTEFARVPSQAVVGSTTSGQVGK